jgi:hypothetical protein
VAVLRYAGGRSLATRTSVADPATLDPVVFDAIAEIDGDASIPVDVPNAWLWRLTFQPNIIAQEGISGCH